MGDPDSNHRYADTFNGSIHAGKNTSVSGIVLNCLLISGRLHA